MIDSVAAQDRIDTGLLALVAHTAAAAHTVAAAHSWVDCIAGFREDRETVR